MEKMPSIKKLADVHEAVRHKVRFTGELTDDGKPIYDDSKSLPKLSFTGTVKLHGTNGSVALIGNELYAHSKNNVLSAEKDNAGFHKFVLKNKDFFEENLAYIAGYLNAYDIYVYGEWCGPKIQDTAAITKIAERSFFVFAVKYNTEEGGEFKWVKEPNIYLSMFANPNHNVYNIFDYPTFVVDIDLNEPELALPVIERLTKMVEDGCPVANCFGVDGIGEGIVWTAWYDDTMYQFKTKGLEHRKSSKPPKRAQGNPEVAKKIQEFAEYATPDWRLEQMLQETFDTLNGGKPKVEGLGDFLKAVIKDVEKEEQNELKEAGLTVNEVARAISAISKEWFFSKLNAA